MSNHSPATVLSFSMFGSPPASPPTTSTSFPRDNKQRNISITPQASTANLDELARDSPPPTQLQQSRNRSDSQLGRPVSMLQSYQPAQVDAGGDTIPELQPIFSYLNSHTNKLYHEGYFLKLHDLDARGRPSTDRNWTECFAQLVGTVLSLWDAAALDAAGTQAEVLPTFLNLSDASIKMIEELPMHGSNEKSLQNVLSISTAANNRYLFHFNSINSLTQWTAAIRLSMYEHATLQEAYTGSLIAGKGKLLNNIRQIMEHSKFPYEDWVRVRFGAGTPWRRCWCVITPPDDKEYQKAVKMVKKQSSYARKPQMPKGHIKFYEQQKVTKKTVPIATITDAYAAYAIYPQSKPLINQSTLIKLEGLITVHVPQEITSEAFLFVMPEIHAGISGFEMLLRWLFYAYDTLVLYGRPNRLVADTRDQRGLMFAMPTDRRYGYLDDIDVSALIHTEGSQAWSERQWRLELKKCTAHKMNISQPDIGHQSPTRRDRASSRASLPAMASRTAIRFNDQDDSDSSAAPSRKPSPAPPHDQAINNPHHRSTESPPYSPSHNRSASEAIGPRRYQYDRPTSPSNEADADGGLPTEEARNEHNGPPRTPVRAPGHVNRKAVPRLERVDSEYEGPTTPFENLEITVGRPPVTPVALPPAFIHSPNERPTIKPYQAPELRRATSGMDTATLAQMSQMEEASTADAFDTPSAEHREGPTLEAHESQPQLSDGVQIQGHAADDDNGQQEVPINTNKRLDNSADDASPAGAYHPPVEWAPPHIAPLSLSPSKTRLPVSNVHVPATVPEVPTPPNLETSPPVSPNSLDGLDHDLVYSDALDRILDESPVRSPVLNRYDEVARSAPARQRIEGQRAGRLRVTGDTSLKVSSDATHNVSSGVKEALAINFDAAPDTGRPSRDVRLSNTSLGSDSASASVAEEYHSASTEFPPSQTVGAALGSPGLDARSSSRSSHRPAGSPDPSMRHSLTPEEWVQHRFTMATQQPSSPPRMARNRISSVPTISTDVRAESPRMLSAGWSRSSPNMAPEYSRTPSGGSTTNLIDQAESMRMQGRNRMQAARVSGSPLLAMENGGRPAPRGHSPTTGQGLYGALQAHDDQKRFNREALRSGPTQQAIAASQHQQAAARQAAHAQAQYHNQQAIHAAQMAQYQAFMRQQGHGPMPMQGQQAPGQQMPGSYPGQMPAYPVGPGSAPMQTQMQPQPTAYHPQYSTSPNSSGSVYQQPGPGNYPRDPYSNSYPRQGNR